VQVRQSGAALVDVLRTSPAAAADAVVCEAAALFAHRDGDRVVIPLLRALDLCLGQGALDSLSTDTAMLLLTGVRSAIRGSTDVAKLAASAAVLCGLLAFGGPPRKGALASLSVLLAHKYPKV
jgi:hypothetical protein